MKRQVLLRWLVVMLGMGLSAGAVAKSAAQVSAAQSARELTVLLQKFTTYQAQFTQVTMTGTQQVLQKSNGTVMIKRPGGFRWETLAPTHQIMLTDGKTLWVYDVDLAQATAQLAKDRMSLNPALLLSGSAREVVRQFSVTKRVDQGNVLFELRPKQSGSFKMLTLYFQQNQLVSMKSLNNLDQNSQFNFSAIQLNKPLPNSLFVFTPPANVDVIRQ